MNDTQLSVRETHEVPLRAQEIMAQMFAIQEMMKIAMKDGEHFGKIPGCGDKPALLKAGAEKLGMMFHLAPTFEIKQTDHPGQHREYQVVCTLNGRHQGVGSCSTLEGKYRFRTGPKESTGKPVPAEYWALRASNPAKAQEALGGKGFQVTKEDGVWVIAVAGEKVEHDNPADYYNTVLKMAKKRAHVDAILTATAASDIFTQDIEEMAENASVANATPSPATKAPETKKSETKKPAEKPAAKSSEVLPPKMATEETKKWFLDELSARTLTGESKAFFIDQAALLPTEELADLGLKYVPTSKVAANELIAKIQAFAFPAESGAQDETWRAFPIPFGKAAGKAMEDVDKKFLFGLWANYEVTTEYNGRPKSQDQIDKDTLFRDMLDAAGRHYEFSKND